MKKRVLSFILAFVLLLSSVAIFSFAEDSNGIIGKLEQTYFQKADSNSNDRPIKGAGNLTAFNNLKNYIISNGSYSDGSYRHVLGNNSSIGFSVCYYPGKNELAFYTTFVSSGNSSTAGIWIDGNLSGNYDWMSLITISGTEFTAAGKISSSYNLNAALPCDYYNGVSGVKESTIKTSKTLIDGILENLPLNLIIGCNLYYHYADFNLNEYFACINGHSFTGYTDNGDGTKTRYCTECHLYQTVESSTSGNTGGTTTTAKQKAVNNNLSTPLSAWTNTVATYRRSPYDSKAPFSYEIQLKEIYTGSEANYIVEKENHFNENPTSSQHWILMKWHIKNVDGSSELKASDIIYTNYFYTKSGASASVADLATLSGEREDRGIFDVSVYAGGSSDVWIGILVDKSIGFPLLRLNNGFDADNNAQYCFISTDPNYTYVSPHTCEWIDQSIIEEATCVSNGSKTVICNFCGKTQTNVIEAFGHDWEYEIIKEATYTEEGILNKICSVCKVQESEIIPKEELINTSKVFTDIKAGKWYTNAINYSYSHGFIAGVSSTEFGRDVPVTRGMFITILARIAGVDTSKTANKVGTKFTDVKSGKYYTAAIKWASDNNIVSGLSDTAFGPETAIERQQLCTMIVNFAKFMKVDLTASQAEITFADGGNIRKYAKTAVSTCQKAGIVSGYAAGSGMEFKPKNTATRAEAAQILYKFHKDFMAK